MKGKRISLLLGLVMALSLAGCTSNKAPDVTPTPTHAPSPTASMMPSATPVPKDTPMVDGTAPIVPGENYEAESNGQVDESKGSPTVRNAVDDVGNAVRHAADDAGRAVERAGRDVANAVR